ncbi:hypothetical protein Stube_09640 [Streptomyces tubercidicus]|uniref:Uncharacterized protein n=1 Tax=Streptomyces tubercidicus TaxID=47759 RepID=A0A640UNP8_9ACTN|nr:hypothetical protein Stube_09640 [Streptomyces tubercidicus]
MTHATRGSEPTPAPGADYFYLKHWLTATEPAESHGPRGPCLSRVHVSAAPMAGIMTVWA